MATLKTKKASPEVADFDIHITIDPTNANKASDVMRDGYYVGKAIKLVNQHRDGKTSVEFIHVINVTGNSQTQATKMVSDYEMLWKRDWSLKTVRSKLEVTPWYSAVPQIEAPEGTNYFEGHAKVYGLSDYKIAWDQGFHVSTRDDRDYIYVTKRDRVPRATFELGFQLGLSYLMNSGFRVAEANVEYCLKDTNEAADAEWLGSQERLAL